MSAGLDETDWVEMSATDAESAAAMSVKPQDAVKEAL